MTPLLPIVKKFAPGAPLARPVSGAGEGGSTAGAPEFFVLYLTPNAFLDNRHGLLKKCDHFRGGANLSSVTPLQ